MEVLNLITAFLALCLIVPATTADYFFMELQRSFEYGEYFTTIYVGNPPQPQSVVIDNYERFLMLSCEGCLSCSEAVRHKPYNYEESFSSKKIECVFMGSFRKIRFPFVMAFVLESLLMKCVS